MFFLLLRLDSGFVFWNSDGQGDDQRVENALLADGPQTVDLHIFRENFHPFIVGHTRT